MLSSKCAKWKEQSENCIVIQHLSNIRKIHLILYSHSLVPECSQQFCQKHPNKPCHFEGMRHRDCFCRKSGGPRCDR